jgi:hypothetical protein
MLTCNFCKSPLPINIHHKKKYCSEQCQKTARREQQVRWYEQSKSDTDYQERQKVCNKQYKIKNANEIRKKSLFNYHSKYKNSEEYKSNQRYYKQKLQENSEWVEQKKLSDAKYYKQNKERIKQQTRKYQKANPSLLKKWTGTRKKQYKNATPSWLTKIQVEEMNQFYWLCKDLLVVTGETYHVDHIIPLQGKDVCGLHVPWNLQVLPSDLNLKKGRKY